MVNVKRFELYWIDLDPTKGTEIKKIRPCVVISPDVSNNNLTTIVIAPITSTIRKYPTRVLCKVKSKEGEIALDQLRAIDKKRLKNKIGELEASKAKQVCAVLTAFFEY